MDVLKFKIFHEVSAGGVVMRKNNNQLEVLIVHRNERNDWSLPKGHLKQKETLQEAALREVKEETSITAFLKEYLGQTNYQFIDKKKKAFYFRTVHWFLMECKNDKITKRKNREILEAIWHPVNSKLFKLLTYSNERKLLLQAKKINNKEIKICKIGI